jgi:superfamily II RNA helicase
MGRDMVSFGKNKPFSETLKENYYKLPAGCYPDEFQIAAGKALNDGKDVLVEAPTGTGKTAIAHYAAARNMEQGKTTFYTTPLKALSNQKLNEFRAVYGDENVGILTGDRRENVDAPIIIMTTEVYRNMALSNMYGDKNPLMENLGTVIFDEFHYLGDPSRGRVWEESLMYTPKGVQTLELSATIGNPEELKKWIGSLNDDNAVLVSVPPEKRHVPLEFNMLETNAYRESEKRVERQLERRGYISDSDDEIHEKPVLSDFKNAVNVLKEKDRLPAIFFVFSRKFSKELIDYLSEEGKSLTTQEEKEEIQKIVKEHKSKNYLGSDLNIDALKNGYAMHNAGIIPAQKELIEELFQKKLLKVVVATETLAAGINMPARTVVISGSQKPTDDVKEESYIRMLTSNEFKQMAGRAGRRGIDNIGYVYTMPTDMKQEQDFLMLEILPSNSVESKFDPDYAFLSGYYEYNDKPSGLKNIYEKSFYVYSPDENIKNENLEKLINTSLQKTKVLTQRGFLNEHNGGYELTDKGFMASKVRGYDALTLVDVIKNKSFDGITPEALAAVAGVMANPVKDKSPQIGINSNLREIIDSMESNIQRVYDKLNNSINSKLKKLGVEPESFTSYEEMLEFAKSIKKPDKDEKTLRREFKEQEARRAKMYVITSPSGKYSQEELLAALKNGETVPTKVLEKNAELVEQYKSRMTTRGDIDTYIEKLQAELEYSGSGAKGNKAKARAERERNGIKQKLAQAKLIKGLDESISDAIAENYAFIKNNPPAEVKKAYARAELALTSLTAKDDLTEQINAVLSIDKYIDEHDLTAEGMANLGKIGGCVQDIINTSLDVFNTESENGIANKINRLGINELQTVYSWANLNKINPSSQSNWYELLKIIPVQDMDEGGAYRVIMQTADLLSQIAEIADAGAKSNNNTEDIEYYTQLKNTAMQARKLLIKEPVTI